MKPLRMIGLVGLVALSLWTIGIQAQSTVLIRQTDLVYQGKFNLPGGIHAGGSANLGFEYGGSALAFDPARQGLFMVGHSWDQFTGEVSIPAVNGTATVLQGLKDATEGKLNQIGADTKQIGGQLVYNSKLYMTGFIFYDATASQTLSHFSRPTSLATTGQVAGPTKVGSLGAGFYSGYMGTIPAEWQAALGGPALTGNCCLSIISRTSYGPAVASFDPERLGTATNLVYYPSSNQTLGLYGASGSHPVFNGSTRVSGVVFPEGSGTVLFIGSTGIGPYCYGEAAACNDPSNSNKGEHAYPYRGYVWAYDARDLAAVKAGTKQAWAVVPYATWELTALGDTQFWGVGGAAYDPATKRVFISEKNANGELPVVHVYTVAVGTTTTPPGPPQNVRIIK